jgi:solute carrier family 35 protein F1/2
VLLSPVQEFLVRKRPLYEVVGQLGMYGMIINGIQAGGLEHEGMRKATWNGAVGECCVVCCGVC